MLRIFIAAGSALVSLIRFILMGRLPPRGATLIDRLAEIDRKLEVIRRKMYYDHPGTHDYSQPPGEEPAAVQPALPAPAPFANPTGMPKTGDPVIQ